MSGPTKLWAVRAPSGAVVDTALSRSHAERLAREHGVILGTCACVEYVPASDLAATEARVRGEASTTLATVTAERDRFEHLLLNLLARIHGDGGHRAVSIGTAEACAEADEIVVATVAERDRLREVVRVASELPKQWRTFADRVETVSADQGQRIRTCALELERTLASAAVEAEGE